MKYKQLKDEQNQPFLPITGLDGVREGGKSLREILAEIQSVQDSGKLIGATHTIYSKKKSLALEGSGVVIIPIPTLKEKEIYGITGTYTTSRGASYYEVSLGCVDNELDVAVFGNNPLALPDITTGTQKETNILCFGRNTGAEGVLTIDYVVAPNSFEMVYPEGLTPLSEVGELPLKEVKINQQVIEPVKQELAEHEESSDAHKELFDGKANLEGGVIVEHEIPAPIRSLTTKFSELHERVDKLSDQIDSVEDNDAVVKELKEMMAGIQTSLTAMEEGLQQVELNKQGVATLDTAFSTLESKLSEVESNVRALETTTNTHTSNISDIYGQLEGLKLTFAEISTEINKRVLKTVYEEKITEIEGIQATLNTKISELQTALGEIDIDLTGSINGVQWDGKEDITITAEADGGRADDSTRLAGRKLNWSWKNDATHLIVGSNDTPDDLWVMMPGSLPVSTPQKEAFVEKYVNIDGVDLNTIKTSGFYRGYTMKNSAVGGISAFLVAVYSEDWLVQIQFPLTDRADIYMRSFIRGTTWTPWYSVSTGSKITSISSGSPSGGISGDVWLKYK